MSSVLLAQKGGPSRCEGHLSPFPGHEIPFAVIEGSRPGPTLLITAGIHGSELSSIEAALRLTKFDPTQLSGRLLVLPIMNICGFRARSIYVNPQDGKNLNRQFPGNAQGTESERLAHFVSSVLPSCDAYLDLHGGDLDEDLTPFTIFNDNNEESKKLAVAFGLETAVAGNPERPVSSSSAARLGVPAITAEIGANGIWNEERVGMHYEGVKRVMVHLGMLPPSQAQQTTSQTTVVKLSVPMAPVNGLWYPRHCVGGEVVKDDVLGEIRDVFGSVLFTATAEVSGCVFYMLTSLWVNAGEELISVATPDSDFSGW